MAKVANPYGLRAVNLIGGQHYAASTRQLKIASGYTTSIFNGDIVHVGADGTIQRVSTAGTAAAAFPAGTVGVFAGVQLFTGGPTPIGYPFANAWAGGTIEEDARAYVLDDPDTCFMIQANGPVTQDMLHGNFGIVHPAAGNRPFSGIALDVSTQGTADTIAFKLIDFVDGPMSRVGDEFTDVIVKFNPKSHAYLSGTGV